MSAVAASSLFMAMPAFAARSAPVAQAVIPGVTMPEDTPWPGGTIAINVDGSDTVRGIWRVTETIPVTTGGEPLVLRLPEWLPGHHQPSQTLPDLADLRFTVDGKPLAWHRDPLDVFSFHVDVPAGARVVTASFVETSPVQRSEGQVLKTAELMNLEWPAMTLYPAGHMVRRVRVRPSLTVPAGWAAASALDGMARVGDHITWSETDYDTLVDSPVFAGVNHRDFDLGHGVTLAAFADAPQDLDVASDAVPAYRALVDEALAAFDSRHFDHYTFLLGLTDKLGHVGLEHHRSSENTMHPRALVDWQTYDWDRSVMPHEITHSWNGKFRRPASLWTPDFHTPMQDDLLWVYEGQTNFWGYVLAARSGVMSPDMVRGKIASDAGHYIDWPGRGWRSLGDTADDPIIIQSRKRPFESIARGEEYYGEGMLVWIEADQIIRAGTHGGRSLDDFARDFFGMRDGDWGEVTYDRGDVIAALNAVYPYDWTNFFATRIDLPDQPVPLGGIERGGYTLAWRDTPNPYDRAVMEHDHTLDLTHSLGISLDRDGRVLSCRWDSPAFTAGIMAGSRILAVNGVNYDPELTRAAITAALQNTAVPAGSNTAPISFVVQRDDTVSTIAVPYHAGLRWPWLIRKAKDGAHAGLDATFAPRRGVAR